VAAAGISFKECLLFGSKKNRFANYKSNLRICGKYFAVFAKIFADFALNSF